MTQISNKQEITLTFSAWEIDVLHQAVSMGHFPGTHVALAKALIDKLQEALIGYHHDVSVLK